MIGYVLMAIAIGLGTVILVYGANGYGIDTKTGQITENGLLFADSKPGGANIYLNGVDQKRTTSARMILTAGEYELSLSKPGYREWRRSFTLDEHSIKRYVYPYLFPETLKPIVLKSYTVAPKLVSVTPDRRFLVVHNSNNTSGLSFDMYDTGDIERPAGTVNLPASLLSRYDSTASKLVEVEWSTDNTHLLLQHIYTGGSEFIILDRTNPTDSVNINKRLNHNPTQVALRDKRASELYVYDETARTLRVANVNQKRLEAVLIRDVHAFKPYGRDLISYVTSAGADPGTVNSRIWDNDKSYPLNTVTAGSRYLLDIARFQDHWYYVALSDTDKRVSIYKDPLEQVKDLRVKSPNPMISFDITGVGKAAFSANTRFLNLQSSQKFGVYDFEAKEKYEYDISLPLSEPMAWMDGHRLIGASGGNTVVVDYDSTNQQTLTPTSLARGGYFSRDYNQFYSLAPGAGTAGLNLIRVDMRAGEDLPERLR